MTVDVVIAGNVVCDAIMGCLAQVSIMPFHVMESLALKPTRQSTHALRFPGDYERIPEAMIENIPVDVGRVRIVTTFHVFNLPDPKDSYNSLLGIPWLESTKAMIKFDKHGRFVVNIRDGDETISIPERKKVSIPERKKSTDKQPTAFCSIVEIGRNIN